MKIGLDSFLEQRNNPPVTKPNGVAMKAIEVPVVHYAIVHLIAGSMCGFLIQWGVAGYPHGCDHKPTAAQPRLDRAPQVETIIHRTAPSPIPLASENDLIPATNLPEK